MKPTTGKQVEKNPVEEAPGTERKAERDAKFEQRWLRGWLWKVSAENGHPNYIHRQRTRPGRGQSREQGATGAGSEDLGHLALQLSGYYCYFLFPPEKRKLSPWREQDSQKTTQHAYQAGAPAAPGNKVCRPAGAQLESSTLSLGVHGLHFLLTSALGPPFSRIRNRQVNTS